jgi:putative phosphoribosyl transferase
MESTSSTLALPSAGVVLEGDLQLPQEGEPQGLVVFVHGSGSSRFSSRNRSVAAALRRRSLATLLFDLLTAAEEQRDRHDASLRFDIPLLAERLIGVLDALDARPALRQLPGSQPIGLFGASTGAAAALIGAAERPERVGGHDSQVLALNRRAAARLAAPHHLEVVAGASHLFEEAGCLERVAELAGDWFVNHLGPG